MSGSTEVGGGTHVETGCKVKMELIDKEMA